MYSKSVQYLFKIYHYSKCIDKYNLFKGCVPLQRAWPVLKSYYF